MADEVLKVVGSADMSSLTRGLTEAQRGLSNTANEALKTERSLGRLAGSGVKDVAGGLSNLGSTVNRTTESLKGSVRGSAQASNALLDLGRVAQDAPFGFIGIANNLNPLLESFQRLQQSSGSTGSALKALGSSLLGPAGIGIALSVVSSLFISFGSEIADFVNSVSNAEKAQRNLNKALGEAEASVAGQVSRLKALVSIAQDVNNSDAKRKEAIGALNKEYDVFNKQLDLSNINTGFATELIDKQTQALIRQAKIRGVENLIAKTTEKRYEVINSKLSDNLTLWDNVKAAAIGGLSVQGSATFQVTKGLDRKKEALQKNTEETAFYEAELRKLLDTDAAAGTLFKETEKKVKSLSTTLKSSAKDLSIPFKKISFKPQAGEFDVDFGGIPFEEALANKLARESINKGTLVLPIPVQPKLEFLTGLPTTLNEIDELKKIAYLKSVGVATGIQDGLKVGVNGLRFPNLTALYESTIATTQLYTDKIKEFSTNAFASLGEAIGNSLSAAFSDGKIGNVFGNLFGSILKSLGEGLKQLGIQAIAASKLIIAIRATLGKPAGILGGIAMIALGTLISSIASKIQAPKFATGTRNFTGGTALVGERGPELLTIPSGASVTPNAQTLAMSGGGNLVVDYKVINGKDLAIILKRTNEFNSRNY